MVASHTCNVREGFKSHLCPQNKKQELWKAGQLKQYLWNEWKYNVHKKYCKNEIFEQWYSNITDNQKIYFECYMNGRKTPFDKGL